MSISCFVCAADTQKRTRDVMSGVAGYDTTTVKIGVRAPHALRTASSPPASWLSPAAAMHTIRPSMPRFHPSRHCSISRWNCTILPGLQMMSGTTGESSWPQVMKPSAFRPRER